MAGIISLNEIYCKQSEDFGSLKNKDTDGYTLPDVYFSTDDKYKEQVVCSDMGLVSFKKLEILNQMVLLSRQTAS